MRLTAREREVLSNPALGWETRYIAEGLGVSWYTARNHIENLRVKLGASSRLEAVMVAMRLWYTAVGMTGRGWADKGPKDLGGKSDGRESIQTNYRH